jgi:protein-S-isoprenylcysteine O-methyltransferase Ste14
LTPVKQQYVRLVTLIGQVWIEGSFGIVQPLRPVFSQLPGDGTEGARVIGVAGRGRRDVGKLIMVPLAAVVLLCDIGSLARLDELGGPGEAPVRWAGTALTCLFYALIIVCYLRRGPAIATHGSVAGWAAAVIATLAPFPLPFFRSDPPGTVRQLAADLLLLAGTAGSVWSLWFLGRNLSVIAQARAVTDRGPYRLVRHPLYTAEMISALGLAVAAGTAASFVAWPVLCAMQVYRARREEQVLLRTLPAYHDYRARTPALVPGLFLTGHGGP